MKDNHSSKGFTLIELLVVISIIAVMSALAIPGMGAARRYANATTCAANLRGIGTAIQAYVGDNDDHLPYAIGVTTYTVPGSVYLGAKIAPYMGYNNLPSGQRTFIKTFFCPGGSRSVAEVKKANYTSYMFQNVYIPPNGVIGTCIPFNPPSSTAFAGDGLKMTLMQSAAANTVTTYTNSRGVVSTMSGSLDKVVAIIDMDQQYMAVGSYTIENKPTHGKRNFLFFDWHVEAY